MMNSLKTFALWLALAAGGALLAADAQIANGTGKASRRVVIIGDSITAGYGLDPEEAYPALLQKKADAAGLPATIVNAGVSGDTTSGGLRRIKWALGPGADIVVIALGGNDGLRGVSPEQTEKNLAGMVDQAREKSPQARILIAGMQMPSNMGEDFVKRFRELFPRVAKEKNATLVPFLLEGVGADPKFNQPDQIHPNAEGQKIVAANIWKVLEGELKPVDKPAAPPSP